jgi:putative alpha-1,2-mannosidase
VQDWSFGNVVRKAQDRWGTELRKIELGPQTPADQKTLFYTAL